MSYPVKYWGPPFHGDTLEDGQHGEPDVVEGGDPEVRTLPLLEADRDVGFAGVGAGRGLGGVVGMTWHFSGALSHDFV